MYVKKDLINHCGSIGLVFNLGKPSTGKGPLRDMARGIPTFNHPPPLFSKICLNKTA